MIVRHSSSSGAGAGQLVEPHTSAMCKSSLARSDVRISRNGRPSYSGDCSEGDSTLFPHPVVGASDGRGAPGADQAVSRTRRVLRWWRVTNARIDNSWLGDLIGAVSLFGSLWLGLLIGHAMSGGGQ